MIAIATAAIVYIAPFLFQPPRFEQLTQEGARLSKDQAASLEQLLAAAPEEINSRAKLMGYYFAPASQPLGNDARIQARRRLILWLIENQPSSALLMTPAATIDARGHAFADPSGYSEIRAAWLQQISKQDATAATLANAARFFLLSDKALAISLYARLRKLEPQTAMWTTLQGSAMAFAIIGISGQNQNGFPSPADPVEAASEQARRIRFDLEGANDAALLTAAALELTQRGIIAQAGIRDPPVKARDLAESLFERALRLDSDNKQSNLGLARIYELRLMAPMPESEKQSLSSKRYQALIRATAGMAPGNPAETEQLLTLARASVDAGDPDRAEAVARSLLAHMPPDAYSFDNITHHGHIILGRVALRRGDTEGAKSHLLDAGRIKEGRGALSTFGPNMTLAKELLEKGEKETVLQYLELCRKFWHANDQLDPWLAAINNGQIPNFGANLNY